MTGSKCPTEFLTVMRMSYVTAFMQRKYSTSITKPSSESQSE